MKLDNQVTGNIGLYYVCYTLSRKGWNVMPTARNARGIDIVAYYKSGTQFIGIQVKTVADRYPVGVGVSLGNVMGDYWIIVNNVAKEAKEPNAFVLLPEEVKSLAVRDTQYWLEPKAYDIPEFKEAWDRIS